MTRYSSHHLWVKLDVDGLLIVGITFHARDALGDIVFVGLPELGIHSQDQPVGLVESSKTAADIYMPLSGEIVECNASLIDSPDKLNDDPLVAGWIFKLRPSDAGQFESLMDASTYAQFSE